MATHQPRHASAVPGERFAVPDPATGEAFDESPARRPDDPDAVGGRAHRPRRLAGPSLAQPPAGAEESGAGVAGGPRGLHGNLGPFVVHRPQEV